MSIDQVISAPEKSCDSWWIIYTRHQHEKVIAQQLRLKEFEIFLPLYESIRRWKDRQKILTLPLFPGYIFIRGELHRRLQAVTIPGVHMILTRGQDVATVSSDEIDAIRRLVQGPFRMEPHPFIRCGDRVRVKCGVLAGIEGILIRKKNIYRLVLSVEILNQAVAVEVEASDIEPITRHEHSNVSIAALQTVRTIKPAGAFS